MSYIVLNLDENYFESEGLELDNVLKKGFATLDYIDAMYEVALNNVEIRCLTESTMQEDMIAYFEAEGDKSNEKSKGVFASIIQGIKNFIASILKFFTGGAGSKAKENLEQAAKENEKVDMTFDAMGAGDFLLNTWNDLKHFITKPFTKLDENDLNKVSLFNNKIVNGFDKFTIKTNTGAAKGAKAGILVIGAVSLWNKFNATTRALTDSEAAMENLEKSLNGYTGEGNIAQKAGRAVLSAVGTFIKKAGEWLKKVAGKFMNRGNKSEDGKEDQERIPSNDSKDTVSSQKASKAEVKEESYIDMDFEDGLGFETESTCDEIIDLIDNM